MDKNNDGKLSNKDYYALMDQVHFAEQRNLHNNNALHDAIYSSLHWIVSDTNGDKCVDENEFVAGCAKLKNRDLKDFDWFLTIARNIKKLKAGASCAHSDSAAATCPVGTSCRVSGRQHRKTAYNCLPGG